MPEVLGLQQSFISEMSPGLLGIRTRPPLSLISLSAHCGGRIRCRIRPQGGPRMYVTMLLLEDAGGQPALPLQLLFTSVHHLLQWQGVSPHKLGSRWKFSSASPAAPAGVFTLFLLTSSRLL